MPWRIQKHVAPGQQTEAQRKAQYQKTRHDQENQRFYRSSAWRRKRLQILAAAPLCVDCAKEGRVTAATVVDHEQDLRDRPDLALEDDNLKPRCKSHHDQKTAKSVNQRRARSNDDA